MMQWYLNGAADVLPQRFKLWLDRLDPGLEPKAEELRLRTGRSMTVVIGGAELDTGSPQVNGEDLRTMLENASQASAHTVLEQVKNGFVTLKNGHRLGLCGAAACRDGDVLMLRDISSLSLRVAREIKGPAECLTDGVKEGGRVCSTLIMAPPGGGKTTLLRDLIRCLSDEGCRVSVADERGEIAAMWNGTPQFDVGKHTDILDGCPKGTGMLMLLRGMTPQVIAVDEITGPEDVQAVTEVCGCGVALLATAHGCDREDLERREVYRRLLERQVFRRLLVIEREKGRRKIRMEVLA